MTTVLTPPAPGASAERELRMLPIAANLLPVEIVESRRGRKVRRTVLAALAGFTAVLGAWYGLASYQTTAAYRSLDAAEEQAQAAVRQQREFADVMSVQAESRQIHGQLSVLLTDDVQWARLFLAVRRAAPKGVQITGVAGVLSSATNGGGLPAKGSTAVELPNASGEKPVGALTVTGTGTGKAAVAAYVDALAMAWGLESPLLSDATVLDGTLTFTVRLDISRSALGGRYTATSDDGSGER